MEQLVINLYDERTVRDCIMIRCFADISGGKAKCAAYGDGETWTNCVGLGRCTLADGPYWKEDSK